MALPPELIESAARLDTYAVEELLRYEYVRVYRIALALSGRAEVGKRIARVVFRTALKVLPKWDSHSEPEHWFHRYTVLTARRSRHPANAKGDLLVTNDPRPDTAYIAFIGALRELPTQQQEALLLHYGEQFNLRDIARAMDCSTEAASNHLVAGTEQMKLVAGEDFDLLVRRLAEAYAKLAPDEQLIPPNVARLVRRHIWPRRLWRLFVRLFTVALIAALTYGAWKLYPMLRF